VWLIARREETMSIAEPLVAEIEHEARTTRRLLERLPEQHFGWKPHAKSMTLERLAGHIAEIPGWISTIVEKDEFDVATGGGHTPPVHKTRAEIIQLFDANVAKITEVLKRQTDQRMMAPWRLKKGGQVIFELPRAGMIRAMGMNHVVHHRGQLSVYLRLRDVPLPSIYGPTADEPM
jgi:uncharacterized damage-inducible protein DinB